jgi:hypothetical protein
MSVTLQATFDGEVFRPLEAVKLPANTRVYLMVSVNASDDEVSFLDVAESLKLEGPSDWSAGFEHLWFHARKTKLCAVRLPSLVLRCALHTWV